MSLDTKSRPVQKVESFKEERLGLNTFSLEAKSYRTSGLTEKASLSKVTMESTADKFTADTRVALYPYFKVHDAVKLKEGKCVLDLFSS